MRTVIALLTAALLTTACAQSNPTATPVKQDPCLGCRTV